MYRATPLLLCSALLGLAVDLSATAAESTGKRIQRYALLIAADDYAPPISKLEYCRNDMQDLQAHLEIAGFAPANIISMNEGQQSSRLRPTKSNILRELNLLMQIANKDDVILVAFSGHGLHVDGMSFLCPIDANLNGTSSLVAINDIYDLMQDSAAGQKLLIVDACRNEPIVRGFKSSKLSDEDLQIQLQSPPRGVVVLSSCEPRQFSAEDTKLQHGVFMYYVMEALEGAADTDKMIGGNDDGRISLDELYYYAHEKTKMHVARSHGIVQRPVMRGELVGRFDLAEVPDESHLRSIVRRGRPTDASEELVEPVAKPEVVTVAMKTPESPLLLQGDNYYRNGEYDNAIKAYTAVISDGAVDEAIRKEARKGRGAAYLSTGDIDNALIDHLSAGLPGITLPVRVSSANLMVQKDVRGRVTKNQTVVITKIVGDWLWVSSVDGSETVTGYIEKSAVLKQQETVKSATPTYSQPISQPYHPPHWGHEPPCDHDCHDRPNNGGHYGGGHQGGGSTLGRIGGALLKHALSNK